RHARLGDAERPCDLLERHALEVVERDDHALALGQAVERSDQLALVLALHEFGPRLRDLVVREALGGGLTVSGVRAAVLVHAHEDGEALTGLTGTLAGLPWYPVRGADRVDDGALDAGDREGLERDAALGVETVPRFREAEDAAGHEVRRVDAGREPVRRCC